MNEPTARRLFAPGSTDEELRADLAGIQAEHEAAKAEPGHDCPVCSAPTLTPSQAADIARLLGLIPAMRALAAPIQRDAPEGMDPYVYYKGREFKSRWDKDTEMREDINREMKRQRLSRRALAGQLGKSPAHIGLVLDGHRTSHTLLDEAAAVLGLD